MKEIFINDFQIHSNTENLGFVVHNMSGLELPGIRQTKYPRPGESGAILSNLLYDGRMITFAGSVFAETANLFHQRRRQLQDAISLTKNIYSQPVPFILSMTTVDDLPLQIECYLEDLNMKLEQMNGQEFLLTLYAPDPALLSQSLTTTNLVKGSGGGAIYPLIYPAVYEETEESEATINNQGTMETYPVIYLNGPLENPIIQNVTNDRFIDLDLTLNTGDQVVIDMLNKTIIQNGSVSVIGYKTSGSKWWWLEKGNNLIRLITDSGSDEGNAQVQHRDAYVGA